MLAAMIFTSTGVLVPIALAQHNTLTAISNVGRVKSSVDDLNMGQGTVSMRVAFVLRSAEVHPLFRDLCRDYPVLEYLNTWMVNVNSPPPCKPPLPKI